MNTVPSELKRVAAAGGRRIKSRVGGRIRDEQLRRKYGIDPPPPAWADMTGYEPMLDVIVREGLDRVDGDVLEIGVMLGGGTRKLCGLFSNRAPDKRVIAVDIFDPNFDHSPNIAVDAQGRPNGRPGQEMATVYSEHMARAGAIDQRATFNRITAGCSNLVVVAGDSTKVDIPTDRLCFAFIDGNHDRAYVRADFDTAWSRLSPSGVVALHDYGYDLPEITEEVHVQIGAHAAEIQRVWVSDWIVFIQKR